MIVIYLLLIKCIGSNKLAGACDTHDLSPGQTILGHVRETSASSEVIALYIVEN